MTPQPVNPVQVAAFIKRRWPASRHDKRADLVYWVRWHMQRGLILSVIDETGRLVGLALGRILHELGEAGTAWTTHEDGKIMWVDLILARRPGVLSTIIKEMAHRWPQCRLVAGNIFTRPGERRNFTLEQLQKFFGG